MNDKFEYADYMTWLLMSYENRNHYEGWELMWKEVPTDLKKDDDVLRELNKKMIEAYPFLLPRSRWTDGVLEDYNYDYNEWEAIPFGWQVAFGWELLNKLSDLVNKWNNPANFRIEQIKEKFGELRIYTNGDEDIWDLIDEYSDKSRTICIECGQPAKYISKGWICPYCEDHIPNKDCADKIGEDDE